MTAKRAAASLITNDPMIAGKVQQIVGAGLNSTEFEERVIDLLREIKGTKTLTLVAEAAGVTEEQVIAALATNEPLRIGTAFAAQEVAHRLYGTKRFRSVVQQSKALVLQHFTLRERTGGPLNGMSVKFNVPLAEMWCDQAWCHVNGEFVDYGFSKRHDMNFKIIDLDQIDYGIVTIISHISWQQLHPGQALWALPNHEW